jgi:hypothetical protein
VEILEMNVHLRARPSALLEDPYGAGWLYETRGADLHRRAPGSVDLVAGRDAPAWMKEELRRLDGFVHDGLLPKRGGDLSTLCDGGRVGRGLLSHLDGGERARLASRFLSGTLRRAS